tara:strand:+ start:720 stop:1391 length:672 start_codon:yes stop_codon:yes gene_type:complete
MPNVGGKKFPYTMQGMAEAEQERNRVNQGAGGAPNSIQVSGPGALGAPRESMPYGNTQQPMFGGMGVGGQGMSGRTPMGGNRSSLPDGWHPPMLLPENPIRVHPMGPNDPYMPDGTPNPDYPFGPHGPRKPPAADPHSHPSGFPHFPTPGDPQDWDPPSGVPSLTPGAPGEAPTNPQKQDSDGNWYEWDGHQWKPIMGPKPYSYPSPPLIPPSPNMLPGFFPF